LRANHSRKRSQSIFAKLISHVLLRQEGDRTEFAGAQKGFALLQSLRADEPPARGKPTAKCEKPS
jgi:hypothetical protein